MFWNSVEKNIKNLSALNMKVAGLSEKSARTFTTTCSSHIQKTGIRIQAFTEMRKFQEIPAKGEFGPCRIWVHMWSNVCGYTSEPNRNPASKTLQTDRKHLDCLPPTFASSSISPSPTLSHCTFIPANKKKKTNKQKIRHPFQLCLFCIFVYFLNLVSLKVRNFKWQK